VCVCVCVCVSIRNLTLNTLHPTSSTCLHLTLYVCMYVCMYVYVCTHTYIHTHPHPHTHTPTQMNTSKGKEELHCIVTTQRHVSNTLGTRQQHTPGCVQGQGGVALRSRLPVSKSYEEEDTCLRVSHMRRRIHALRSRLPVSKSSRMRRRIHACE